jgi:hypothetical protein
VALLRPARYNPTAPALYGSCISLKNISSISHLGSSSPLHSFMASLSLSQRYLLHSPSRVILSTRSMASNTLLSIPAHVRTPHCRKRAPRLPPNHMASRVQLWFSPLHSVCSPYPRGSMLCQPQVLAPALLLARGAHGLAQVVLARAMLATPLAH